MASVSPVEIVREFGVIHLKNALNVKEQEKLYKEIQPLIKKGTKAIPGNFVISSGDVGDPNRKNAFNELGELLFNRCADALSGCMSVEEMGSEPSLVRLADVKSGKRPVKVHHVGGVCYQPGAQMCNHTDCDRSLFTMSVAIGDAIDFTVGRKTHSPKANERSGKPVVLRMNSGDAIFFDGGGVPHQISAPVKGTSPEFWNKKKTTPGARISLLFREPDWV